MLAIELSQYRNNEIIFTARTKLKKLEQANEQAEQTQQFSQAELRMRKTQQVKFRIYQTAQYIRFYHNKPSHLVFTRYFIFR